MTALGFLPREPHNPRSSQFLTFIVPTFYKCNLKCSFCIIDQRQEIIENILTPADYADFIAEVTSAIPITNLAIQGHEPLLPSSLPYTISILRIGSDLHVPCTFVTNGVYLGEALPHLTALAPNRIGVSLDAASAHDHDGLRGVKGAWAATTKGIRDAVAAFAGTRTRLTVISTHMPRRAAYLLGMPNLLRALGVDDWIVNPLLHIRADAPAKFPGRAADMLDDFLMLQDRARAEGVHITIDDEFDLLRPMLGEAEREQYAALNVKTLPPHVTISRLLPSGHCSVGADILRRLPPDAPRWRPGRDDPAEFLRRLVSRRAKVQEAA